MVNDKKTGNIRVKNICLTLLNHYTKRIPASKNHIQVELFGVGDQIDYSDGIYKKYKICSQLDLCLYEEEDNNDYYNAVNKKNIRAVLAGKETENSHNPNERKSFFYHINHSLLESIIFEFSDGSIEEIKIPLVAQKIYYDACNDLHLCLAEPQTYITGGQNDLISKKAVTINYS